MEKIAVSIWNFVRGNPIHVIGWIVTIVVAAFLAPHTNHRLRRVSESRDAHLAELKKDLLEPMLQYLSDHVLPVLEHRLGNVGISRRLVPRPSAGVMEEPTEYSESFCLREEVEAPIDAMLDASSDKGGWDPSQRPLYLDGQNHFPGLFQKWKHLIEGELASYHVWCIARSDIADASRLLEFRLDPAPQNWVHSTNLALLVFYRQLGLERLPFSLVPRGTEHAADLQGVLHTCSGSRR